MGAVAAAPMVFTKRSRLWAATGTSKIVIVYNPRASGYTGNADGTGTWNYTVNQDAINSMVDAAIKKLTGAATVGLAWEQIIKARVPSLSATTKIGIKINTSVGWIIPFYHGSEYTTKQRCPFMARGEVAVAILSGLKQMLGGTYKLEYATVFDRKNSSYLSEYMPSNGFPAGGAKETYDVGGANGQPRYLICPKDSGGTQTFTLGPFSSKNTTTTQHILKGVMEQAAYINIGIPKINIGSGVTGVLKNTYGTTGELEFVDEYTVGCSRTHPYNGAEGDIIHDCVPRFYKEIDARVPCVLNVLDALAGNYDRQVYNGDAFLANTISMSTDPVTTDFLAVELVNKARRANGWSDIQTPATSTNRYTMQGADYPGTVNPASSNNKYDDINWTYSKHVNCHSLAIAEELGLGHMNAGERFMIDQTSIANHGSIATLDQPQGRPMGVTRQYGAWRLDLDLDRSGRTHRIESRIMGIDGSEVRSFPTQSTRLSGLSQTWDGRTNAGLSVAKGVYCWEARVDGVVYSQTIHHR